MIIHAKITSLQTERCECELFFLFGVLVFRGAGQLFHFTLSVLSHIVVVNPVLHKLNIFPKIKKDCI